MHLSHQVNNYFLLLCVESYLYLWF